ncbi:fimbrial protein [Acinetobacter stercoris]
MIPVSSFATPQVTFQGEVTTQTCQASINGESNGTVLLPTVSADQLATAGATTGLTPFTISVSGCTANPTDDLKISTKFLGHNTTQSGNLGNLAANDIAAKNVSIQLTTDSSGSVPVQLNGVTSVEGLVLNKGETTASHQFAARYFAEDAVTAGAVTAVAEYTLSYQ